MKKKILAYLLLLAINISIAIAQTVPTNPNYCSQNGLTEGNYPHPLDCRFFYYCDNSGNTYSLNCAPGMGYDVMDKTCEYMEYGVNNPAAPCND